MITPEDIEVMEVDDPMTFTHQIRARLRLNCDVAVTEFALRTTRADVLQISRDRARRDIWNKVYGDFIRELHGLRMEVRHRMRSEVTGEMTQPIEEKFDRLYDMLRLKE